MSGAANPQRTCTVYFDSPRGRYAWVTMARTVFEAVRNAWDALQDPWWQGPRPTPETVFEVSVTGSGERFRVAAQKALLEAGGGSTLTASPLSERIEA